MNKQTSAGSSTASELLSAQPRKELGLFDSICIIVGIIIGAGIFKSTPLIASSVPDVTWLIGVWLAGGILSLIGALCYAELATTFPHAGGDYVFLTRAYGRGIGFLFAWCELWIVRPGSIGAMAFVFATYAQEIFPLNLAFVREVLPIRLPPGNQLELLCYAAGAVTALTVINMLGVREGKWTQNLLTTLKVLSLVLIFIVGIFLVRGPAEQPAAAQAKDPAFDLRLAMILVLFTYGGWNEMAYVAAEVKNPTRNILRALVLGTLAVTTIYVLTTVAFVQGLGFSGVQNSGAVASDLLRLAVGDIGGALIALIICISALGSVNGQIFTGARVYYAMGRDHRVFSLLGHWEPRRSTPVWSLLIQGIITLGLVAGFGWYRDGFENLIKFTTPIFWTFFFLVGASLFVLRWRYPDVPRPYRTILYPITPLIFCGSCLFMIYSSVTYAIANRTWEALWAIGFLAVGAVVAAITLKEPPSVVDSSKAQTETD